MADSVRISELREEELRAEAAERAARGLSPDSPPERVVRTYVIDGRERRVSFVNSNPIGFAARLSEYHAQQEGRAPLSSSSSSSACPSDCPVLPPHARINDGRTPRPSHPVTAARGGGLVPIP